MVFLLTILVQSEIFSGNTATFAFTISEEGNYRVTADAINVSSVAMKPLNFVIDKTAPVINVSGVVNGQTYTAKPTIAFTGSETITAQLTKTGGAAQNIATNYQVADNGSYTLVVSSTDAAGNTTTQTITFTVNVSTSGGNTGGNTGGGTVVPPVVPVVPTTPVVTADVEKVITADAVDVKTLSATAQKLIGTRPVYDFSATVDGKAVTAFGSGTVTVKIPYVLGANEDPNAIVVYYIDGSGNLKPILSKYENGIVTFITNHFSTYAVAYNRVSFLDVIGTDWFAGSVNFLASKNIIKGKGSNLFAPLAHITRGEIVSLLASLAGADLSKFTQSTFNDVKDGDWYMPAIQWAYSLGLVKGMGENNFAPKAPISRQDLAVILSNYAKLVANFELPKTNTPSTFADQNTIATYASPAVFAMQRAGFISGKPGNLFDAKGQATRAEVAKIIEAMIKAMVK